MKTNKITLICSCIIVVITAISYSIFGYCCNLKNEWIKDISLAVLGSAIIVVITSIIGYILEKRRNQERIIQACSSSYMFDFFLEEGTKLNLRTLSRLSNISLDRIKIIYMELKEYYQGCFFKDKELKKLINEKIIPYVNEIINYKNTMSEIVSSPDKPPNNLQAKFDALYTTEQDIDKCIRDWMQSRDFLLGNDSAEHQTDKQND